MRFHRTAPDSVVCGVEGVDDSITYLIRHAHHTWPEFMEGLFSCPVRKADKSKPK